MSFLCEILCFGAIIYTNFLQSDKVKDIVASADWLDNIQNCLKKMNPETRTEYEKVGVAFDQRLVLMLVLPIRYCNLKSLDVNNVSFICVGMVLFREILFMI